MNSYDSYRKMVEDNKANIVLAKEVDQNILLLKTSASEVFDEQCVHCFTFKAGEVAEGQFGFSEHMVNQLMQTAFNQGQGDVDERSFADGYNACRKEMLIMLNAQEKEYD